MTQLGFLLSVLMLLGPLQSKPTSDQAKFEPLLAFYGTESLIQERQQHRILSREAWQSLLMKHYGAEAPGQRVSEEFRINADTVEINFSACMVLAFFDGTVRNSQGLRVSEIEDGRDRVRIRLIQLTDEPLSYATLVNPYVLLVTPRSTKRIEVEMLQTREGREAWVSLASFPALATAKAGL